MKQMLFYLITLTLVKLLTKDAPKMDDDEFNPFVFIVVGS
jgi:hypothetical protein